MELILASASPRRKELLSLLTENFVTVISEADEALPENTPPAEAVRLLAERKARAVAKLYPDAAVIGSDTVVAIDGKILGKPENDEAAAGMLRLLSGREHEVLTGVCVIAGGKAFPALGSARVRFAAMTEEEIAFYVATGECRDKAGAYGIQGIGCRFIERIEGDYYSVVGLPLQKLYKLLSPLGVV